MTPPLLGAVLCGGKSSRMGTDKANLAHPTGVSYLQYSYQRLTHVCDKVVISGNSPRSGNSPHSDYEIVPDMLCERGPAAGVAAVLQYARANRFDACCITPVDMPDLTVDDLVTMHQKWLAHPEQTVCGISQSDARLQPLVAIYPAAFLEDLTQLANSKDRSLHRWIASRPHETLSLTSESCRNVNRPEDI
tara:strand:+ start:53471 stop:54043 length:573 start_codon:yes stop_codon:yes gene_type:complete